MNLPNLKFYEIKTLTCLEQIKNNWELLFGKLNDATPFQSWEWNYENARHSNSNERLIVLILEKENEVIGIAPFILKKKYLNKINRLEFIGSNISDYLDILCLDEYKITFINMIYDWLISNEDISGLSLKAVNCKTTELFRSIEKFEIKNYGVCPVIELDVDFQDYIKRLPGKFRRIILAAIRNLQSTSRINFKSFTRCDDIMHYINKFIELHQKRHLSKGEKGKFFNETKKKNFKNIIEAMSLKGYVRLSVLFIDEIEAVVDVSFFHNKIVYGYLNGINPDYLKYSPGSLSLYFIIKNSFEEGIQKIDLMRGSEEYKYKWTNKENQTYLITFSRNKYSSLIWRSIENSKESLSRNKYVRKIYKLLWLPN